MKRFFQLLTFTLLALLVMPVMAFAQGGTDLPGLDLGQYFVSLAAMIPLVTFLTSLLKKLITLEGFAAQLTSWLIAIALAFLAWLFHLGLFAGVTIWWHVVLYGFAVGLAANGFFKIELVLAILKVFGLEPKDK